MLTVWADCQLVTLYNWKLHPRLLAYVDRIWGPHTVDSFADGLNHQINMYNSLYWDPWTAGVDALAQQNWGSENNFVNLPFILIPQIWDTIVHLRATTTIIAPWWPVQAFYARLQELSISSPIKLPTYPGIIPSCHHTPEPLETNGASMPGGYLEI